MFEDWQPWWDCVIIGLSFATAFGIFELMDRSDNNG